MTTDTTRVVEAEIVPYEDDAPGEDVRTHIVRPGDNGHATDALSGQDVVDLARLNGTEVVALCGHRFIPTRDTAKHPVCDPCLTAAHAILEGTAR